MKLDNVNSRTTLLVKVSIFQILVMKRAANEPIYSTPNQAIGRDNRAEIRAHTWEWKYLRVVVAKLMVSIESFHSRWSEKEDVGTF